MSENKAPDIRFKEFHDEWASKLFSEVFDTTIPNNTLSRANLNYENGEVKNIHYGDILIKFGEITNVEKANIPFVTDLNITKYKGHFLADGDVIFADTAEDETVGKVTEITGIGEEKVVSGLHTIPVRPRNLKPVGYFGYYINSNSYHKQLLALMQGIKVLSISKRNLANTKVRYPLLDNEQTKIGEFFKNLDNLIAQNQKKYDKLVNMKKACLDKMFPKNGTDTPEVRFKEFSEKWERKELSQLVYYIVDNRGKNPAYYCDFGIPVIDNFMIQNENYPLLKNANRYIDDYLYKNFIRKYSEYNDVLITLVGNGIGNITLFPNVKSVIIQNTLGLRFSNFDKHFMFYSILSKNSIIKRLDRGMAQPSIRQDELLEVIFPIPTDIYEQTKIGTFFQNLDHLITLQKTKLEKLKNIKKACLDKMFI